MAFLIMPEICFMQSIGSDYKVLVYLSLSLFQIATITSFY